MEARPVNLVPAPRFIESMPGSCDLGAGGAIAAPPALEGASRLASLWLGAAYGKSFRPTGPSKISPLVSFALDDSIGGEEDYHLTVKPGGVSARVSGYAGAVRAAATLRELALSEGRRVPALRIEDGPRFSWRGLMLDVSRNFFSVDFIERLLDLAALHKLSRFHWHLTDDQGWRLDLPSLPEIAKFGSRRVDRRFHGGMVWREGCYTAEDVRRVVAYAAERAIVVVPEIETPGHVLALLASHPELSCAAAGSGETVGAGAAAGARGPLSFEPEDRFGIFEDVLCAGNEKVFELLGRVYDDLVSLFPGPWVHSGGDEVPKTRWSSCPRCRSRMEALNLCDPGGELEPEGLQGWFTNRVAEMLALRDRRMVGWDEILEGGPRQDAIVMSWRGPAGGIAAARAGHQVVMSPNTAACYLDHKHLDRSEEPGQFGVCTVRDSYSFDPVPAELSEEEAGRILGAQANVWTEIMYFGAQVEYMVFPRLCALSEVFWSPRERRDFLDFVHRLETHGRRLDALGVNRYRGPLG